MNKEMVKMIIPHAFLVSRFDEEGPKTFIRVFTVLCSISIYLSIYLDKQIDRQIDIDINRYKKFDMLQSMQHNIKTKFPEKFHPT